MLKASVSSSINEILSKNSLFTQIQNIFFNINSNCIYTNYSDLTQMGQDCFVIDCFLQRLYKTPGDHVDSVQEIIDRISLIEQESYYVHNISSDRNNIPVTHKCTCYLLSGSKNC